MSTTSSIIVLTALLTFVPALESFRNKKIIDLFLIIIFGLFLMFLQIYKDVTDTNIQEFKDRQIDTLQTNLRIANERCSTANSISNLNFQLGQKIETLTNMNISIDSNTHLLVEKSNNLLTKNVELTKAISPLTKSVKDLVSNLGDEVTGGISIPMLEAYTVCDSIPYDFNSYHAYRTGERKPTGKWVLKIYLRNTGPNKLTDISLVQFKRGRRYLDRIGESLQCPNILLPYDTTKVEIREIADIMPNLDNEEPYYYRLNELDDINVSYTIKVKWRNATYSFSYKIVGGYKIGLNISYEFRGKLYNDSNIFLSDIQDYIRKHERVQVNQ